MTITDPTTTTDDPAVELSILSVGRGDIRMTFDEAKTANSTIRDMMRQGYIFFVEVDGELKPVKRFDPEHNEYVVQQAPKPKAKKATEKRVPARGRVARAVGATAGG